MADGIAGRLLVATPSLRDPNFERTVVLLLDHSPDGALGVVLNRPTETAVDDPLPQWSAQVAEPAVVFVGGPVQPEAAIGLARCPDPVEASGWQPLFGPLGTLDLASGPADVGVVIDGLRIFAGYAGWGPGQLETEIEAGAWFVVDAAPGDALSGEPKALWHAVLRRQPGLLSTVANFPADPAVN
jgi:putative transcriptional regulator